MFSIFHVHCKFLARGQSVHYGRCSVRLPAHTQCLSTISHYDVFLLSCFSFWPFGERVWGEEYTARRETKKTKKKLKFKVSLESEAQSKHRTGQSPLRRCSAGLGFCWSNSSLPLSANLNLHSNLDPLLKGSLRKNPIDIACESDVALWDSPCSQVIK